MRVLICNRHPQISLGGSEIQCDLIARHLLGRGHHVVYAALEAEEAPDGVPYRTVEMPRINGRSLMRLLTSEGPDLVYWRYNRNNFLRAAMASRLLGIKSVFSVSNPRDVARWPVFAEQDNPWWTPRGASTALRRTAQQVLGRGSYEGYRFFDGVVSLSINLLNKVPPHPMGPPRRAAIYNSMHDREVAPFLWPRQYVAWVANLKRCKNPEQFLELARRLRDLPIDFLMCGAIQHEEYAYVDDPSALPENVFYLGPKSLAEVNGILRSALCMVHTCDPEGFGNNFIQSWLQQTPTVSLYFDPDELIQTRRIGFVSRTPSRFEEHVRRLWHDEGLRRQMGRRARDFARRQFNPARNLPRFEEFFEGVLGLR